MSIYLLQFLTNMDFYENYCSYYAKKKFQQTVQIKETKFEKQLAGSQ